MINESADLFEPRNGFGRAALGEDLLEVLSAKLARLVERHRATQRAVSELREALAGRDRRIVELDAKLASAEQARGALVERIDALLADVDKLMQEADEPSRAETEER